MNWRWIAPAAVAIAAIEAIMGFSAYGSKTWNFDHTKVLTHWAAVREVCLVYGPLTIVGFLLFAALFIGLLEWASRGRR